MMHTMFPPRDPSQHHHRRSHETKGFSMPPIPGFPAEAPTDMILTSGQDGQDVHPISDASRGVDALVEEGVSLGTPDKTDPDFDKLVKDRPTSRNHPYTEGDASYEAVRPLRGEDAVLSKFITDGKKPDQAAAELAIAEIIVDHADRKI